MKKFHLVSAFSLLMILVVTGCKKDPKPVDPPLAALPNITISPSSVTLDYNSSVTFSWEAKGTASFSTEVYFGEEKISTLSSGSYTSDPLTFSTVFSVRVIMDDGRTSFRTANITVNPEVVLEPPKIFLVYVTDSIQYDSSFFIEWTTENANSLLMNDQVVPVNGHFMFGRLKSDTTIRFRAVGPGGVTTDSATIKVADAPPPPPPNPNLDIIVLHPWRIISYFGKDHENDSLVEINLPQSWLDEKNIFKDSVPNNWSEIWLYGQLLGSGPFWITDTTLVWGNGPYRIVTLNQDTMKIEHWIPCYDCEGIDSTFRQKTFITF